MNRTDSFFRAVDVALDYRKLLFIALGLGITGLVADLLFALGSQLGGSGIVLFTLLALVALWAGTSLILAGIAHLSYQELAGQPVRWTEGLAFAVEHWSAALFGPLVLVGAGFLVGLAEFLLLYLARIPILGELLAAVAFVPLVLLNALMLLMVLAGGWLMYAAIAGGAHDAGKAAGTVVRLVRHAPFQVVLYWLVSAALAIVVTLVAAGLLLLALLVSMAFIVHGLGIGKAVSLIDSSGLLGPFTNLYGGLGLFGFGNSYYGEVASLGLARLLFAVAGVLLLAILEALPIALQMAASCVAYTRLMGSNVGQAIPAPAPTPSVWAGRLTAAPAGAPFAGSVAPPTASATVAAPVSARFCTHCGRSISGNSRFCTGCGAAQ